MNFDFLTTIITGAASSGLTWFLARKKNRAEAKGLEIANLDKAAAIWREVSVDLKAEVGDLIESNKKLLKLNTDLTMKVNDLTIQNEELTKHVRSLEAKFSRLATKNKNLLTEIKSLQK